MPYSKQERLYRELGMSYSKQERLYRELYTEQGAGDAIKQAGEAIQ
jgi:hypothetical protein